MTHGNRRPDRHNADIREIYLFGTQPVLFRLSFFSFFLFLPPPFFSFYTAPLYIRFACISADIDIDYCPIRFAIIAVGFCCSLENLFITNGRLSSRADAETGVFPRRLCVFPLSLSLSLSLSLCLSVCLSLYINNSVIFL